MQDLNDLAYFAEVVDQGSFAAAARTLGVPKSRLSRRVAELEARLGVRLLQRTTRRLSLTEAGALYHRHCVALREAAEAAGEAIAQVQTEPRGTIRVACPVTLAQGTIGALVPEFLARHPQVRIEMQVSNRVVDLVQDGVDVALRVRATLDDSGSLVVKQLARTSALLVAAPMLLAGDDGRPRAVRDLDDLRRLPTVAMSSADGRTTWQLLDPDGRSHALEHRPVYTADDLLTIKFAALRGLGMTVMPDYLCQRELDAGTLRHVLPGWAPPVGIVHAVFPSRRGLVPAVRRFLDFLGARLGAQGVLAGLPCPADLA